MKHRNFGQLRRALHITVVEHRDGSLWSSILGTILGQWHAVPSGGRLHGLYHYQLSRSWKLCFSIQQGCPFDHSKFYLYTRKQPFLSKGQPSTVRILSKYHSFTQAVQLLCTCYKLQEYNISIHPTQQKVKDKFDGLSSQEHSYKDKG